MTVNSANTKIADRTSQTSANGPCARNGEQRTGHLKRLVMNLYRMVDSFAMKESVEVSFRVGRGKKMEEAPFRDLWLKVANMKLLAQQLSRSHATRTPDATVHAPSGKTHADTH